MNPFRFFSQNLFLKILSLAFAILLWFFVVLEDKVDKEITAQLKLVNIPQGLVLVKEPPAFIYVKVSGPRSILRNLEKNPLVITLNLKNFEAGRHIIRIRPSKLNLPAGLSVKEISPSQVEVVLEKEAKRTVKVKPVIYGAPPPGWKIEKIEVSPSKIKIRGPRSLVFRIREIPTKPVDISSLTGEIHREVLLDLPPLIKTDRKTVEVIVKIVEKIVTRELKDFPIRVVGNKKGPVKVTPSKVNIILQGPENVIGAFTAEKKIKAIVDVKNLEKGKHVVEVKIILPPKVKLLKIEPRKIEVIIE
ncbi:YbbR family protein [Thermodesulfatator indicus DSM 15286]|uniref:YbbR family protein n=1 Tax=Thermodesulfatator indicus (strain DSM 15286 / JCM 11887 / CIR29812) TaxID=667014 RepID=F8A8F6_THEID|nr:CdaR family protein [Thermodesulfatator indicus]AEH43960.1 YbbR family protein [Thermodesulfatator indicus DSM 15286]